MRITADQVLGRGIASPVSISELGRTVMAQGIEKVKQGWRKILSTPVGSVFSNRTYGSELDSLIFDPVTEVFEGQAKFMIRTCLEKWERRASVDEVRFSYPTYPTNDEIEIIIEGTEIKTGNSVILNYLFQKS